MNAIVPGFTFEAPSHADLLDAAAKYAGQGLKVVPDKPKSKVPAVNGWTCLDIAADQVAHYFPPGSNISVRLGIGSGRLCCVDIDETRALRLTDFLPKTGMVHGRAGMPRSHHLYIVIEGDLKSRSYKAPSGEMLVEILYEGRKVSVPPSIHPSGELVQSYKGRAPATLGAGEITMAVSRLGAAAPDYCLCTWDVAHPHMLRGWPGSGPSNRPIRDQRVSRPAGHQPDKDRK